MINSDLRFCDIVPFYEVEIASQDTVDGDVYVYAVCLFVCLFVSVCLSVCLSVRVRRCVREFALLLLVGVGTSLSRILELVPY